MMLPARVHEARRLLASVEKNHSPAVFACAYRPEHMVVLDLISRDGLNIRPFLVDTGHLPHAAYALHARVRKDYGIAVQVFRPWPGTVDAFLEHGRGPDATPAILEREPLRRALSGRRAWITGWRREHAGHETIEDEGYDAVHRLWQYNPLADWSHEDVAAYLQAHRVPHDPLAPQPAARVAVAVHG